MERSERAGITTTLLEILSDSIKSDMHTAIPGIIQSFDPTRQTAEIQPAIQARVTKQGGTFIWVNLPKLVDCPVFFPSGGGFTLTFPINNGDECLVVFSERCIDAWWQAGGYQNIQSDLRIHDLSDGFAFVGFSSNPRVINGISGSSTQLRSDDGNTSVDVANGQITLKAAQVTIEADQTTVTGMMTIEGLLSYQNGISGLPGENDSVISGDIIQTDGIISSNGIVLDSHVHSGVETGGGTTGGPI